jgi:hypothetical protein
MNDFFKSSVDGFFVYFLELFPLAKQKVQSLVVFYQQFLKTEFNNLSNNLFNSILERGLKKEKDQILPFISELIYNFSPYFNSLNPDQNDRQFSLNKTSSIDDSNFFERIRKQRNI